MKKMLSLIVLTTFTSSLFAGTRVVIRHKPHFHRGHVRTVVKVQPNRGYVDINCDQKDAKVFVNGNYAGTAGQFDGFPGKLTLKPGAYTIRLQYGKRSEKAKVFVSIGSEVNLNVDFK